jgi:hypothetical protein
VTSKPKDTLIMLSKRLEVVALDISNRRWKHFSACSVRWWLMAGAGLF